ncbi:MAG: protein-glutamate O-methyltransferase CheR [Proteobacteria bacterium]|nr:protein-glutamate O-methyltransferase CheR [Pseudomonadota bacterium]
MPLEIAQNLTFDELVPIRDLIADASGLFFDEKKFYFIEKRIAKRIKATNTQSPRNYFRLLKLGGNSDEMKELIASLTTNETYFFRYLPQLESFAEEALPMVCKAKRARNDYILNIWSAGCSSGEEPYTIYILLKEHLEDFSKWKINLFATDIDHKVLEKARRGLYEKRAVKDVSPKILGKYFSCNESKFHINEDVKDNVRFDYLNLMDRKAIRSFSDMDFVFCRNVLIYFDDKARKQVINSIYDCLAPGGFIFLGHSESVGKISATFKLIKLKKSLSYQK